MEKEKIYGYDYDEVNKKFTTNKSQSMIVSTTYDLFGNYKLASNEIAGLFNGKKTIIDIIVDRIYNLNQTMENYDKKLNIDFENLDLSKSLQEDKDIQKNIINPLLKSKNKIKKIDSSITESLLDNVDNLIMLIEKRNEINGKYNNFEEIIKLNKDNNKFKHNTYSDFYKKI